jgi:hypothetical protein
MTTDASKRGNRTDDWDTLVELLSERKEELVENFVRWFSTGPRYDSDLVTAEDIQDTAVETMDRFILLFRGEKLPEHLAELPTRLGIRRARQGVPRDSLMTAVRGDFTVLWDALHRIATPKYTAALVDHVDQIFSAVEYYVSEIQHAFLLEQAVLTRSSTQLATRFVSRLFNSDQMAPTETRELAEVLRLPVDGQFEVVAAVGDGIVQLQERMGSVESASPIYLHEIRGVLIAFREQPSRRPWSESLARISCGYVGGVVGLIAIPQAARSAAVLAKTTSADHRQLVTIGDAWIEVAAAQVDSVFPGFRQHVLTGMANCQPRDRQRLEEVVHQYARTGSVKDTASSLFCHRNTVINRLRSFQELTGLDVTVPKDMALALLALAVR